MVSRIEQGLNGEISAYISVAAGWQHNLSLAKETTPTDDEPAGLDLLAQSSDLDG